MFSVFRVTFVTFFFDMITLKERIIKEANQSREKMLTTAEIDIEKMKQNASKELQKEVSSLAVTLAEKILKENIDKDGDKIINNFIEEVGE